LQICALHFLLIMEKRLILVLLFICLAFAVKAEGYRISVNWQGIKDTSVFLANYYDTKIYVNDTLKLDQKGKGIFEGKEALHQGLYVLYLNEKVYFDILIGADQNFSVETNNTDIYSNLKINGAIESENFLKYQNFLHEQMLKKSILEKKLEQSDSLQKRDVLSKLDTLENMVSSHIASESKKNPGSMYSLFLKTSQPVVQPPLTIDKNQPKYDSIA
jgi:hypothetical protein